MSVHSTLYYIFKRSDDLYGLVYPNCKNTSYSDSIAVSKYKL